MLENATSYGTDCLFLIMVLFIGSCSLLNHKNEIGIYSCHESSDFIEPEDQCLFNSKLDYFRGIWYGQTKLETGGYKYAGGLGTYTSHHGSTAIYHENSNKTFFTYGGTRLNYNYEKSSQIGPDQLYIMVAEYDHQTDILSKPTLVFDKWTNDPHDNPSLGIDPEGHILLFAPSHGDLTTPSYILKSTQPASVDSFKVIEKSLFAYPQIHMNEEGDGVLFYTSYQNGRILKFRKFIKGKLQSEENVLSSIQAGHYQISTSNSSKIGTAFNFIPRPAGSDYRTNLYYLETLDNGKSWQSVNGNHISLPISKHDNSILIKDYEKEGKIVYIMDMEYDDEANPVIIYNVSSNPFPDDNASSSSLMVSFYKNNEWNTRFITTSDHNYNMGTLKITDQKWTIIAPTTPGPQKNAAGGELELWASYDKGYSWKQERRLTTNSINNHNYVKKVENTRNEFGYIWADGNAITPSDSRLYYTDGNGLTIQLME